jgi:hypothetical protein
VLALNPATDTSPKNTLSFGYNARNESRFATVISLVDDQYGCTSRKSKPAVTSGNQSAPVFASSDPDVSAYKLHANGLDDADRTAAVKLPAPDSHATLVASG